MPLATGLAAVLTGLLILLAVRRRRFRRPPAPAPGHPESLTAVLEAGEEEYLAWLADHHWPGDEYLELERDWRAELGLDGPGDVRPDGPPEAHESPLCPRCALRREDVWPCPACGRLLHSSCGHGMRRRRVAHPYRTRGGGFESVIAEWICTGCTSVVGLDVDHGDEPDRR
ncbi:hypothetical protein BJF79_11770 [Actinomadura sp. CNU-125]|uniref:hypothetical protein n=1 Tax=Actinomadura sp. CNU-125 TaxID=1904961 RepID=UPI0009624AFA|nr:hypothetical protein [Actinomadura sp. CNU-125]OLT26913.1 hypothetical protein BJF79_11770 [Actinomadura sp. CNU-125]